MESLLTTSDIQYTRVSLTLLISLLFLSWYQSTGVLPSLFCIAFLSWADCCIYRPYLNYRLDHTKTFVSSRRIQRHQIHHHPTSHAPPRAARTFIHAPPRLSDALYAPHTCPALSCASASAAIVSRVFFTSADVSPGCFRAPLASSAIVRRAYLC